MIRIQDILLSSKQLNQLCGKSFILLTHSHTSFFIRCACFTGRCDASQFLFDDVIIAVCCASDHIAGQG
jgi:hypothetical protein